MGGGKLRCLASVLEVRDGVAALVGDDASEYDLDKHNHGLDGIDICEILV